MIMTVGQRALGAAHERGVARVPEDKPASSLREPPTKPDLELLFARD